MVNISVYAVYAIDRDNGDGHYARRLSFTPLGAACRTHPSGTPGLADYQDTDGGEVATIVAPEGARLDGPALVLPDGTRLTAHEALRAARQRRPWLSFGLRIAD